ncbi:TMEM165/GDT1 family protein [Marinobacterium sediminicola]|uniref:GDT1 family protein n=1 Tax=Marinobacterium sediminicola TaxID=518898 RepID=A0ABY1RYM7_9GAMM|nr:TMEM165/GDT1 family protein [Marinobacterium sediminicola]ULG68072.1 TMEM165/GDT1 family protein [Marinobacterium sediminicola]SMR73418.1 Putative Ca2+/H+ antiporter, TMEM165/GDT1 family [Marinobacterium sediminicola]
MDAFLPSTLAVAIAEIGDKTQLLTLFLTARFAQRNAIILGIFVATLLNHGLSAWLGAWLVQWIPENWVPWIIGLSFIAVGLWVLIPDKDDEDDAAVLKYGAFIATCVLFFIAEIGDKTQVATVILAARYDSLFWVIMGTTIGMMLANVPVAYAGNWLMQRIPLNLARWSACGLFVVLGVLSIVAI